MLKEKAHMPYITKTCLRQIYETLDKTFFSASSFKIETPEKQILVKITYLDDESYSFSFYEKNSSKELVVTYSPGELKSLVTEDAYALSACLEKIRELCGYIRKELKTGNPLYDELEKMKADFADKLNEHFNDSKLHFSKEEVVQLNKQFSQGESAISESFSSERVCAARIRRPFCAILPFSNPLIIWVI